MKPLISAAVLAWGVFAAVPAAAAPVGPLGPLDTAGAGTLVERVHGCHRNAQDSVQGWHRHVGPYCRTVRSGPSQRNPYARCRTQCRYVGPIKQCRRVCYR